MKSSLPERRLIPRWRPVANTLSTSEIESGLNHLSERLSFDRALFDESVAAWRSNPTAGHLGDIVSFSPDEALRPTIAAIVDEAAKNGLAVTDAQRTIFAEVRDEIAESRDLHVTGSKSVQSRVSQLRKELLVAPDNVLALLDMAQLQLASGKLKAAKRHLFTALNLSPNGRIVLRTAARFLVHQGEPERAHSLISRHPATKGDPWLMASEIALSQVAQKQSLYLSQARRFLKVSAKEPRQLAELAGAVANREIAEGGLKQARSLLRFALEQPTDNVIAQAMIDGRQTGLKLDEPSIVQAINRSSEAQLLQSWMSGDEASAEAHALSWHAEEPFSSRPLQFLTTLYSLQGEYDRALRWVQRGLIADPVDPGLISNLGFTQAAVGKVADAEATIKRARSAGNSELEPFFKATEGLIALRRGDFEIARTLYREAEDIFRRTNRESVAALCIAHYAKFAAEFGAPAANELMEEAQIKVNRAPTVDGRIMLSRLAKKPLEISSDSEEQRRLSQWIFDPVKNTLTQRVGVTSKGAPAIVVQPSRVEGSKK